MLVISPSAQISKLADIEDSVRGTKITIGDGVFIDAFVKLRVAGGMGDVTIGPNCYINAGSVLYSGNGITLGEYVLIAANCTLAPTNHEYRDPDTVIRLQGFAPSRGGIVVEDDVWIGANCVLLDGARIGRGAVIAAGSVVRGALPAYSISAGNPAKVVKWRKKPSS
jgi:virginiamycin A acetyltransferase